MAASRQVEDGRKTFSSRAISIPSSLGLLCSLTIDGRSAAFQKLYEAVADDSNLEAVKAIFNDAAHDQRAALLSQKNSDKCMALSCRHAAHVEVPTER